MRSVTMPRAALALALAVALACGVVRPAQASARLSSDNGQNRMSSGPANMPTPKPTPVPATSAQVLLPSTGVEAGTPFDVTLTSWPGTLQPEAAWLVAQRKPKPGELGPADENMAFRLSPLQFPGGYTLHTTIPDDVSPGIYAVRVAGRDVSVLSNAFAVVVPPDRADSVPPHQPLRSRSSSATVLPTTPLTVLVAGMLLIVIASLARGAVRQRDVRFPVERGQALSEREQ